jgi:hypothetical protein
MGKVEWQVVDANSVIHIFDSPEAAPPSARPFTLPAPQASASAAKLPPFADIHQQALKE